MWVCGALAVFRRRAKTCEAVFIPDGTRFNTAKLMQLTDEKGDIWKLQLNTMVSADAGTVHPKQFATRELATSPKTQRAFKTTWQNALKHAGRALPGAEQGEKEEYALDVVRNVLFLKLTTVFANVLEAASIAKNWIVVDRVNAKSPAAELLIEASMSQTTARPTILVVDAISRLKKFTCPEAKECIETLKSVKALGGTFGTDDAVGEAVVNQFYDHNNFLDPNTYAEKTIDELPRPAEPAHIGPDGTIPPRVKWQYYYLQTFFNSGTHYIVLDHENDAPDLSGLGPFGYVCANGQAIMYDRLRTRIQSGESLVMLHNTGGVVQAFCSLRRGVLSKTPVPDSSELLEKLELVSPQPWAKNFGLPDILMIKELHERAPMLLRTTVLDVDLLEDNTEKVLQTLTCCFSGGGGVPELGLGDAEKACILTAWKRHMTLMYNAAKFEKQADYMQLLLYALAVITTFMSVLLALENAAVGPFAPGGIFAPEPGSGDPTAARMLSDAGDDGDGGGGALPEMTVIGYSVLMLPITSAFVTTVRSRMRPREKWATCLMAGTQIVDQIYKYRLRTDKYDTQKAPPPLPDGTIPEIPPKIREANARAMFVETCNAIYTMAISTEVSKGGALKMGPVGAKRIERTEERLQFEKDLKAHLVKKLHAGPDGGIQKHNKPKAPNKKKGKGGGGLPPGLPPEAAQAAALAGQLQGMQKQAGMLSKLPIVGALLGGKTNKVAIAGGAGGLGDLGGLGAAAGGLGGAGDMAALAGAAGALGGMPGGDMAGMLEAATGAIDDAVGGDDEEDGGGANATNDDMVSQIPIEDYIACRARPLTAHLEKRALVLSRRLNLLEFSVITLQTAGSVLAVLEETPDPAIQVPATNWIVVTVALASQCMAIIDYFYLPAQLAATNKALENCHNMLSKYDSLSLVQRKTRGTKLEQSACFEGAILEICSSRTAMSSALPGEEAEDEGEE